MNETTSRQTQLETWLAEENLADEWWLSVNGEVLAAPVSLTEAFSTPGTNAILHTSKTGGDDWIRISAPLPPAAPAPQPRPHSTSTPATGFVCATCGHYGQPRTIIKGSVIIEIFLWLFILVPGIIYSIWRASTRHKACPSCETPNMLPLKTPGGRQAFLRFHPHGLPETTTTTSSETSDTDDELPLPMLLAAAGLVTLIVLFVLFTANQ